jgi:hypothetical protein
VFDGAIGLKVVVPVLSASVEVVVVLAGIVVVVLVGIVVVVVVVAVVDDAVVVVDGMKWLTVTASPCVT